jgi:hypothetical protein
MAEEKGTNGYRKKYLYLHNFQFQVTTLHCICDYHDGETYNTIFFDVTSRNMAERFTYLDTADKSSTYFQNVAGTFTLRRKPEDQIPNLNRRA